MRTSKLSWLGAGLALALMGTACKSGESTSEAGATAGSGAAAASAAPTAAPKPKLDFPGTAEGAKALLAKLVAPESEGIGLSGELEPTSADYAAVFMGPTAKKAEAAYKGAWASGAIQVKAKAGQTEIKLFSATTEELQTNAGESAQFPGGYSGVAGLLQPGLTFYRFKFTEPGNDLGMAYDGLVYVNGHWRLFPKPWKAVVGE